MGIRPHLYFGVAIPVTKEPDGWTPIGWPEDWQEMKVFGPTKEEVWADRDYNSMTAEQLAEHLALVNAYMFTGQEEHGGKQLYEFLVYDAEFGLEDTAFYIVDQAEYDADFLYALAAIHSEYNSAIFVELPKVAPEDDFSSDAIAWRYRQEGGNFDHVEPEQLRNQFTREADRYQALLATGHNYSQFRFHADIYFDQALWLMNRVLKVDPPVELKDLKLGIMWKWS